MSLFSDPQVNDFLTRNVIPIVIDVSAEQRRADDVGKFLNNLFAQDPLIEPAGSLHKEDKIKQKGDRQGNYLCTADGKLIVELVPGTPPKLLQDGFQDGLRKFKALPKKSFPSNDVPVVAKEYDIQPPQGTLIVSVFTKVLLESSCVQKTCSAAPPKDGTYQPAWLSTGRNHLWITASELKEMDPTGKSVDTEYSLPSSLLKRIAYYHMVNNSRPGRAVYPPNAVRLMEIKLKVVTITPTDIGLQLTGSATLDSKSPHGGKMSYDAKLLGTLNYNTQKQIFTRFDAVALGNAIDGEMGDGVFVVVKNPLKRIRI